MQQTYWFCMVVNHFHNVADVKVIVRYNKLTIVNPTEQCSLHLQQVKPTRKLNTRRFNPKSATLNYKFIKPTVDLNSVVIRIPLFLLLLLFKSIMVRFAKIFQELYRDCLILAYIVGTGIYLKFNVGTNPDHVWNP